MLVIKADEKADHLTVNPSLELSLQWLICITVALK